MLRVLHCVHKMDRGGIETLLMNIYREIDRRQVQFDFLVTTLEKGEYDDEIESLGGVIHRIPSRREGVAKYKKNLKDFFKMNNYIIIHQHVSSLTDIQASKEAKKSGIKNRIIHSHNTKGPRGLYHLFMHNFNKININKYATKKIACSEAAANWVFGEKNYGEVIIFNNAINTEKFIFDEEKRNYFRNSLEIKESFVLGHIGRFSEQKNHDFIIDVFKEVKITNEQSKLILIGVGKFEDKIKKKVTELDLANDVMFLGSIPNVEDYFQAMDAFIFPSLFEGLGIVAIEAQASGVPVFASEHVPKEANVTSLFHQIHLSMGPSYWAKNILANVDKKARKDYSDEIKINGFDIKNNTTFLLEFYKEKGKKR